MVRLPRIAKKLSGIRRPYRTVPNRQVLDAASQFHEAYRLLARQPPFSGVLLAELHCAFIALELYLKSLSATEVEVPHTVLDFGAYVYATSPVNSHDLGELYDLADSSDRHIIDQAFSGQHRLQTAFPDARSALVAHNEMFMSSRYHFEPQSDLAAVEMGRLTELLDALEAAISKIPHRFIAQSASSQNRPNKRLQPTAPKRPRG